MAIVMNVALAMSVISLAPSAAAFTPMVFASAIAALVAVVGIWQGHIRRGLLTVFFAVGAALVSPTMFGVEAVEWWLIALYAVGTTSAAVMYWRYKKNQNNPF